MPDVSVVLCVYNTARYVGDAVESILRQEGVDFELIVIDDASTDGSHECVATLINGRSDARIIRLEQNVGLAGAMNRGIAEAKGAFLAQMDSDDIALPHRLATQLETLAKRPEIDCLGSTAFLIDGDGRSLSDTPLKRFYESDLISWLLPFANQLANPTMMSRTEALRANPYSREEMFRYCVDYELWCRMNWRYTYANLAAPLMKYRMHQNQGSLQHSAAQNKAALECGRRCASELIGEEISTLEMSRLHEISSSQLSPSVNEFKQTASLLLKMLVSFLQRKMSKGEAINTSAPVINDYMIRMQNLAAATQQPASAVITLLEEQKNRAQEAILSLATRRQTPPSARAGAV